MAYSPRIPVADSYITALGRAAYNFAYLEWGVVWLVEDLQPGFLKAVRKLTAGQIAQRFKSVVASLPTSDPDHPLLTELADLFIDLVNDRNALLHGKPFTAKGGEQRLLYSGRAGRRDWTADRMLSVAQSFEAASIRIVDLFYARRKRALPP